MYEYKAEVIRVVDGNTMHLRVDLGLDCYTNLTIRLINVNTPEMHTHEGKIAKAAAEKWLAIITQQVGKVLLVTHKDKREKYGRYLGTLYSLDRTSCLNTWLVNEGFAEFYDDTRKVA